MIKTVFDRKKWIMLLILLASVLYGCSSEIPLLAEISERDANEVIGALLNGGINAKKVTVKGGVSVIIDSGDMANAVAILKAAGLPNKAQTSLGEVFKKEGVISTPLEERARYIYALSQELEYTLSQIDGVMLARVHVVLPERIAPGQPIQPSSAAIFIKHQPELDPDVIGPRVHNMVASSIPGLSDGDSNKISVSFVEALPAVTLVKWEKLGPFIVQQKSVTPLKQLLIIYTIICVFTTAIAIVMTLPGTRSWLFARLPLTKNQATID